MFFFFSQKQKSNNCLTLICARHSIQCHFHNTTVLITMNYDINMLLEILIP